MSDITEKLEQFDRDLFSTDATQIYRTVRAVTTHSQELDDFWKSDLWYRLDRLMIARFCPQHYPMTKLPREQLIGLVQEYFPNANYNLAAFDEYWVPQLDAMESIIKVDWTQRRPYIAKRFTCVNFGLMFWLHLVDHFLINSVAWVWGSQHVYNFFFTYKEELRFWFFAPQSDQYWSPEENAEKAQPYDVWQVIM